MGKIIAVCSGCGGVGRSTIALSISLDTAKKGRRTILLDASGEARSCDLMLGLASIVVVDMMDVVRKQASIQAALYSVPNQKNLHFACASLYGGVALGEFSSLILALRAMCDYLVIDLPSGPVKARSELWDKDDMMLLLTRPDDISIRALERTISEMTDSSAMRSLVINRADSVRIKKKLQYSTESVEMLLDMPVSCVLHEDESLHTVVTSKGVPAISCDLKNRAQLSKLLEQVL